MSTQVELPEQLTKDMFLRALPKQSRFKLSDGMISEINEVLTDPQLRENFRDNLLSYAGIMADGKYKIVNYINAVRYVSHKALGSTNIEAYAKTFPGRYQRLVNEGADNKTISSYSTAYNKTDLVIKISEQTLVPTHILNADIHQKAINKLATLMNTATSEKVQCDSATSLLVHLKPPEASQISLDVNIKVDKSIEELRQTTLALAVKQRDMIQSGIMNARDVAHSELLIEGEIIDEN